MALVPGLYCCCEIFLRQELGRKIIAESVWKMSMLTRHEPFGPCCRINNDESHSQRLTSSQTC